MERSVESACQCQVSVLGMGVGMNTPLMVGVRNVCTAMHTLCEFYVIAFDTHVHIAVEGEKGSSRALHHLRDWRVQSRDMLAACATYGCDLRP